MTYIDDKYNKESSTKKGKNRIAKQKDEDKKHKRLVIIFWVLITITAVLVVMGALALDRSNSEKVITEQERKELSKTDEDRINIVSSVLNSLLTYQSNNRGKIPNNSTQWTDFLNKYVGNIKDSDGAIYELKTPCEHSEQDSSCTKPSALNWKNNKYEVYIATRATCGESVYDDIEYKDAIRKVAIYTALSNDKTVCVNN